MKVTHSTEKKRKAAADPVRLRILERLQADDREWTAKELASALALGANGLYYHLRVLEEAGLVVVTGAKAVGRMAERTYRPAKFERLSWEFDEDLAAMFAATLEAAKAEVTEAVYAAAERVSAGGGAAGRGGKRAAKWPGVDVAGPAFATTRAEAARFSGDLKALVTEYRARAVDARAKARPADVTYFKITYALRETALPTEP